MAQVGIRAAAAHLGAGIADLVVGVLGQRAVLDRAGKAGPAAARVVLVGAGEQRFAGHHVHVDAVAVMVPVLACEGPLGALVLGYTVLLGRQPLAQFGVAGLAVLGDFVVSVMSRV